MLQITPLYLAVAVAMYSLMAFRVIGIRRGRRISLGDGGQPDFQRLIRGHANFAEYAPLALVALSAAELSGAPPLALHAAGMALIAGRALHAYCFLFLESGMPYRVAGMALTFTSLWMSAGAALSMALGH